VGLIHVENAHTHPVLVTFVNMVKEAIQEQRDKDTDVKNTVKESYHKVHETSVEDGKWKHQRAILRLIPSTRDVHHPSP
jgi:fructose-bisphosphate aldolase class 1